MNQALIFTLLIVLFLTTTAHAQGDSSIGRLEKDIPELMRRSDVPGFSAALIRHGSLIWIKGFGVMNAQTKEPVTKETVFEANSLGKPVFAYAVLRLVDEGKLDLDTPVVRYMGDHYTISDDPRMQQVTARMLLSHSSGADLSPLPADSNKLILRFNPGTKWSYSWVGIAYLGKVVEKITGMSVEDYMQAALFRPLGMKSSSYVWEPRYEALRAFQHDWLGNPLPDRIKPKQGSPAGSLQTTPGDYARFVIAVMNGELLKRKTWEEMMKPQIKVNATSPQVSWGLGWGLEMTEEGESFWHWGDGGNSKDYITAFLPTKDAILFFANSANGLFFTKEIVKDGIGGKHPGIDYLGYRRYDSPTWLFLKSVVAKGADTAMKEYLDYRRQNGGKGLTEGQMNSLAHQLLDAKKVDEAIKLFEQNTVDFPLSANAWNGFAEGFMTKGDAAQAIRYFKKALELDPKNDNARSQIEKMGGK